MVVKRIRLDQALVARGLCESREKARRAILAGQVRIASRVAAKASELTDERTPIELVAREPYVSRGGLKLAHALAQFAFPVKGLTVIDLGASTGGFTDCLLQHGAARVYAVDVGQGQLAWQLRQDARVVVMERTNARHLQSHHFPAPFAPVPLVVIDCSFISLRLIVPAARHLLAEGGSILALIKPQFEAGKAEVNRGAGVIRDPEIHRRVLDELREFFARPGGLQWRGTVASPILGPAGNQEFIVWLEKSHEDH